MLLKVKFQDSLSIEKATTMSRTPCPQHGTERPCTCAMGKLYRFVEPLLLYHLKKRGHAYGYELVGELNEHALTDSTIERGAVYRTLRTLEENGNVISDWDVSGSGPARRKYHLTPDGEIHLEEWAEVLGNLSNSMGHFVSDVLVLTGQNKKNKAKSTG